MRRSLAGQIARLPSALKGRISTLLGRTLWLGQAGVLETNFGIAGNLNFRVPGKKYDLVFGHPSGNRQERATLDLCAALSAQAHAFYDVGANHGLFTAMVAQVSDIPIVALEADPSIAAELAKNFQRSRIGATLLPVAADSQAGTVTFLRNLDDDSSGSLTEHFSGVHSTVPIEVAAVPLATLLRDFDHHSVLMKIDVEGAGLRVWQGLEAEARRVDYLVYEIIGPESETRLPEIIVAATGMKSYYIDDYRLTRVEFADYTYRAPFWNWLFTHATPAELRGMLPKKFEIVAG